MSEIRNSESEIRNHPSTNAQEPLEIRNPKSGIKKKPSRESQEGFRYFLGGF